MLKKNIHKKRNAVYSLSALLTFTPKRGNWEGWEHTGLEENVKESMEGLGGELISFEKDHGEIRIEISYPPKLSISSIVNVVKSRSGRALGGQWDRRYIAKSTGMEEG